MSLLNDVLRDLDRRRRDRDDEGPSVLDGLRASPESREDPVRTRGAFAIALVVTLVAAWVVGVPEGIAPDEPARLPAVAARPPAAAAPVETMAAAAAAAPAWAAAREGLAVPPTPEAPAKPKAWRPRGLEDIARPIEIRRDRTATPGGVHAKAPAVRPAVPAVPEVPAESEVSAESNDPVVASADRLFQTGLEQAGAGRIGLAEAALRECLSVAPDHREARATLATLLAGSGRGAAAISLLEGGRRLLGESHAFANLEARIRAGLGDNAGALALLERAGGDDTETLTLRAALAQRAGRHLEAAELYSALVRRDARRGTHWMGLGISLEALGESGPAVNAYERAQQAGDLDATTRAWTRQRVRALGRERAG